MLRQALCQWLSCPLGLNTLISIIKHNGVEVERYKQVNQVLQGKELVTLRNKLFVSANADSINSYKKLFHPVEIADSDFSKAKNNFRQWVDWQMQIEPGVIEKDLPLDPDFILANVTKFVSPWNKGEGTGFGPYMKLYNSFNYTDDIRYDARLLELPMLDHQFKLVMVVPNEADLYHTLFTRLNNRGWVSAVTSVQPIFPVTQPLNPPNIEFNSRMKFSQDIHVPSRNINWTAMQYGKVKINEHGTHMAVLTCMYSSEKDRAKVIEGKGREEPVSFSVIFADTPIFSGQYTKK